jgi:hypothetical protein
VIEAMGAVAGLVWLTGKEGRVEPIAHLKMHETGLSDSPEVQAAHSGLVQTLMSSPSGLLVPPQAALTSPDGKPTGSNPSNLLVIGAPIDRGESRQGLIEIFHQPNQTDVERGYLKFLQQVSAVAGGYLERRQIKTLDTQQSALEQVDRFSRALHESLNPIATAFVLANEARRIIGCDRVSVLVKKGRKLRLEAVSGQESIERRATAVRAIQSLARVVAKARDPLWHPDAERELPPQIEEELENYIDESHATAMAIIPLEKPRPTPIVKQGASMPWRSPRLRHRRRRLLTRSACWWSSGFHRRPLKEGSGPALNLWQNTVRWRLPMPSSTPRCRFTWWPTCCQSRGC